MKREAAPTEPEVEAEAAELPAETPEAEPAWKPYVLYGGIAAGVLAAAGLVAIFLRK
jgi:hypothetical protein